MVQAALPREIDRSRSRWVVVVIAAGWLLINVALLWMYFHPQRKTLVGDEAMYHAVAMAWLQGQAMNLHFIWPPGQVWWLATSLGLSGGALLPVLLLQSLLLAGCGVMLYRLWLHMDRPAAALFATALFLLNPGVLAHAHWLWPEVPHLACLLASMLLLADRSRLDVTRAALAGALVGVALLFKSLLAAFWPLLVLVFLVRLEGRRPSVAWRAVFAFIVAMAAVTSPAWWKGWVETGRPVIADSSVYNLYVGLLDVRRSDYIDEFGMTTLTPFLESAPTPRQRNAIHVDKIVGLIEQRGVVATVAEQVGKQYFRLFNAKTLLVSQLPGAPCAGRLGAYGESPLVAPMQLFTQSMHGILLVLAAFGIAMWRRWRQPLAIAIGLFFGYQLALYLGLHVMQRYLFPFLPFLCGFAGSALAAWTGRSDAAATTISRPRLLAGAVLAMLLLGLAWLGPVFDGPTCPA